MKRQNETKTLPVSFSFGPTPSLQGFAPLPEPGARAPGDEWKMHRTDEPTSVACCVLPPRMRDIALRISSDGPDTVSKSVKVRCEKMGGSDTK